MPLIRSYRERRRAKTKTVAWFFAAMGIVTLLFIFIVGVHYLLGWW